MRNLPKQIKFTKDGLEKVRNELQDLENRRPDAVKELTRAREMGDLSENGLYHAAKSNLRSIDSKIRRLGFQIKLANVVASPEIIVEENGEKIKYQIVGDFEADPGQNKVSANSPIGRSLIGKRVGEEVKIVTPRGIRTLKIIKT